MRLLTLLTIAADAFAANPAAAAPRIKDIVSVENVRANLESHELEQHDRVIVTE